MIFYVSHIADPFFNLALEELLVKNHEEEYTILSINEKSVITGKHQCAHRETDTKYITEQNIPVIRRISGGGTVFHDPGNLNFTFIRNSQAGKQIDFGKYSKPVIDFLKSIGIEAEMHGSDLRVNDQKISGNAEHVFHNRVLHHGTLLFDASLANLKNSLRKDTSAYITRAVSSNPAQVTNLKCLTSRYSAISELKDDLLDFLMKYFQDSLLIGIPEKLMEEAELLARSKYSDWRWNYAYGPEYEVNKISNIFGKKSKIELAVKDGIIVKLCIEENDLTGLKLRRLEGCRHMPDDILNLLKTEGLEIDVYDFF